jgi:hypothetical protein
LKLRRVEMKNRTENAMEFAHWTRKFKLKLVEAYNRAEAKRIWWDFSAAISAAHIRGESDEQIFESLAVWA